MIARPLVKAAGGKTKLLPHILPRLPEKIDRYFEPFVGGGAVFFALAAEMRLYGEIVLNDKNADLANVYNVVRGQKSRLVKLLREDGRFVNEEAAYYRVRAWEPTDSVERAARFIYMNKVCFNGLHRVNKAGKFNVPFGRYENPTICDEENITAASLALAPAKISSVDFADVFAQAGDGDVVYCDPPYLPISATSDFTAYTADGFSLGDHERLRDSSRAAIRRGVHVLISNSATSAIRDLYSDGRYFKVEEVDAARAINSDASKRGKIKELLISGRGRA